MSSVVGRAILTCDVCKTAYRDGDRHACAVTYPAIEAFSPAQRREVAGRVEAMAKRVDAEFVPHEKETNPKDAVGIRKVPFSCMSGPVLAEVGLGMMEGACKYGRHNYRVIGVRASVYFDAAGRHLWGWWEGQDIDPDSNIHHISKLIADLMVLRDAMIRGNWVDDRPPRTYDGWIGEANGKASDILDRYPNPKSAYTEENKIV